MKRGPFLVLSATFPDDPDIIQVGERAAWLYVVMACDIRQHRGDGVIDALRLPRLGIAGWRARIERLIEVGLVQPVQDGYLLRGYLNWNYSERDYHKKSAIGKVNACKKHHTDCMRDDCAEARKWLENHGYIDG